MKTEEIRQFVEKYLDAHDSQFVEKDNAYVTVTLPKEVDKDLGNRPFYWTYCERMGIEPTPLTITFIFDREQAPSHVNGEWVGFGTRRLQQIFKSAVKHGRFVRLYEDNGYSPKSSAPLIPWLGINYRAEFICDQKKDLIISLGINLVNGQIISSFFDKICILPLTPKLPDYHFTMQSIFSLRSAVSLSEDYVKERLDKEDSQWADKARSRMEQELHMLNSFYNSREKEKDEEQNIAGEYEKRVEELKWQYEPRIKVNLINTGLFYLQSAITP